MAEKNIVGTVAVVLAAVGAINWGLAVFNLNLVTLILGSVPILVQVVYALVGISGLVLLYSYFTMK